MRPFHTFGDPVNAAPAVARTIAHDNAENAWADLGRAYTKDPHDEVTLMRLRRIAVARRRKLDKAYDLKFGEYMRIQPVM